MMCHIVIMNYCQTLCPHNKFVGKFVVWTKIMSLYPIIIVDICHVLELYLRVLDFYLGIFAVTTSQIYSNSIRLIDMELKFISVKYNQNN